MYDVPGAPLHYQLSLSVGQALRLHVYHNVDEERSDYDTTSVRHAQS